MATKRCPVPVKVQPMVLVPPVTGSMAEPSLLCVNCARPPPPHRRTWGRCTICVERNLPADASFSKWATDPERITQVSGDRLEERDRVAIFSRYNYVNSKWHKWQPHPELLAALPPKRRTLFRPVHVEGNLVDLV